MFYASKQKSLCSMLFLPVYLTDLCSLSCLGSTDLLAHNDRAVSSWWLQIVNGGHPAGLEKGWCMGLPPLLSRSLSYHLFFCSGASQLPSVSSFPFDLPHRKNQWHTLKSNRSLETRVCYSFIQAVLVCCMPTNTEAISLTIHFSVVIW